MRFVLLLVLAMLPWVCSYDVIPYSSRDVDREEVARLLGDDKPVPVLPYSVTTYFRSNDLELVKDWVLGEGDANSESEYGDTLLQKCVDYDLPEMAAWLIGQGANVDLRSGRYGHSPLQDAASRGSLELVGLLVDADADLEVRDQRNRTALHTAAQEHQAGVVELLLNAGANPLVLNKYSSTPLHSVASMYQYYEHSEPGDYQRTAKLLIEAGVDVNATQVNGQTALDLAVDNAVPGLVKLLLNAGADQVTTPLEEPDMLHLAVAKGSLEMVTALVEAGAEVDAADKFGRTALNFAAQEKHYGIADYLVEAGADPTIVAKGGGSALHWAAYGRETGLCRKMITAGAVPDLANDDGSTPLVFAASGMFGTSEQQAYDTLGLLLEFDQNVNVANSNSMYPIHYAASAGYIKCAKLLLEHGARVDVHTEWGLLPIHIAARRQHRDLVSLLTSDSVQPDIFVAYRLDDKAMFNALVDAGADLNEGFEYGHSVLTMAAWNGKRDWLDMLLALGADVNHAGNDGSTALMKSCVNRYTDIAKKLLEHGADPGHRADNNVSVLHIAADRNVPGVVAMLLDAGASPNVATAWGDTPLHWAARKNDFASAEELLIGGADVNVQNDKGETPFFLACKGYTTDLTTAILLLRWSANPCIRDNDGDLPKQNHSPKKTSAEYLADQPPPTYSPAWFDWYTKAQPGWKPPVVEPEQIQAPTPEERVALVKEAIGCCE